jgi:histidinol phosphatase-like enzyme
LFKSESKWSKNQKERATVLFDKFPDIKLAYNLSQKLSWIYENSSNKTLTFILYIFAKKDYYYGYINDNIIF